MTLSDRLVELMKEKGIGNRAELAKGAEIPYTTIVAIFEKSSENTKLSTLKKLSKFFGITLDDLTRDSSEEPETIAAHHDGEDWTEDELEDIEEFKELLKLKRQLKSKE